MPASSTRRNLPPPPQTKTHTHLAADVAGLSLVGAFAREVGRGAAGVALGPSEATGRARGGGQHQCSWPCVRDELVIELCVHGRNHSRHYSPTNFVFFLVLASSPPSPPPPSLSFSRAGRGQAEGVRTCAALPQSRAMCPYSPQLSHVLAAAYGVGRFPPDLPPLPPLPLPVRDQPRPAPTGSQRGHQRKAKVQTQRGVDPIDHATCAPPLPLPLPFPLPPPPPPLGHSAAR